MPITKTMAYKVGNDAYFTLEDAQVAALVELVGEQSEVTPTQIHYIIRCLVTLHIKEIVKILSGDLEDEKPARKPRSDKGTKRAKAEAINRAFQDGKQ